MLRFSVLLCFALTCGISAKPLKPWEKVAKEAVQKGWVSIDDKGMASWGVEVEPPEDMDETSFDIDPSMKIWKRVQSEQGKQYQMAEKDLDDLQHPSTEDLLGAKVESKPDALPAADGQVQDDINNQNHPLSEPEEDMDDVYHKEQEVYQYLAPLAVGYEGEPAVRPRYTEPEEDEDDKYHADVDSRMQVIPLMPEMETRVHGRLHLVPEEDMDDIYHRDVPEMVEYNFEAQPAAEVDWIQRKYTEPEEDMDSIYHN